MTAAMELWEKYLPMARGEARRQRSKTAWVPLDDLQQVACLGLWKAVLKWEATREVPFPAYARRMIRWELLECCWRHCFWGSWANRSAHENKFKLPKVKRIPHLDGMTDEATEEPEMDRIDFVNYLIGRLHDERTRHIVRSYWIEGESSASIAKKLNLSVFRVQQLNAQGKHRLQSIVSELKRSEDLTCC